MSLLFGRKTAGTRLGTINYARGLVVSLYLVSWLFSLIASMLAQTNNGNLFSCQSSIFACIFLYALSKIIIYLFLAERCHIVTAVGITRWNCPMYKFNMALLVPYLGILTLAIVYRNASLTTHGVCEIGLQEPAAIPLIAYDVLLSGWLTGLFVRALISSTSLLQGPTKSRLRDVARRTLLGSILALILSCANISMLVYFDGHERGLICLASCTLDVTLNAITIHWVTSRGGSKDNQRLSHGGGTGSKNVGQQYAMQGFGQGGSGDKAVNPLNTHISVSIESYVEEYYQMHQGRSFAQGRHD
ncbi:hypothetical protein BGZ83_010127 [Gryganskiella cystojenkinii]|nr:hypothetical protein BGZ83_010127 [Gryganskiella cystojenkinii]